MAVAVTMHGGAGRKGKMEAGDLEHMMNLAADVVQYLAMWYIHFNGPS